MASFEYPVVRSPYVGSISDLIAREGEIRAHAAMASGQAWAGATQQVGQAVGGALQQIADPRRQMDQIALDNAKQEQAGQAALTKLQTPTVPNGPMPEGETATPQNPYMKKEGDTWVWDTAALGSAMAAQGKPLTPTLLKGLSDFNETNRQEMAHRQQFAATQQKLVSQAAGLMAGFVRAHPDLDLAQTGKMIGDQFSANGSFPMDKFNAALAQVTSDPATALSKLDALSRLGAETMTVSKDAIVLDKNNPTAPPLATNAVTEPGKGDYTINGQRFKADGTPIGSVQPPQTPAPVESAQIHDKLLDGKPTTLTWEPKSKQWLDASGQVVTNPAQRIRPIPSASETTKPVDQNKLEQEYRTVLVRGLSSRSGGLGLEDAKVQQANHLLALMDQNFDPKTGQYNIPKVQYEELALGLARLVSPGGQVGEGMKNDLVQATAAGDLKKVATYLTGTPFNGSTQDVFKMLKDSIQRQGSVAMDNREGEMRYLRGLAPTELDEGRRTKLEETSLNPLRQTRVIRHMTSGEQKLQTSIDGGKTWK